MTGTFHDDARRPVNRDCLCDGARRPVPPAPSLRTSSRSHLIGAEPTPTEKCGDIRHEQCSMQRWRRTVRCGLLWKISSTEDLIWWSHSLIATGIYWIFHWTGANFFPTLCAVILPLQPSYKYNVNDTVLSCCDKQDFYLLNFCCRPIGGLRFPRPRYTPAVDAPSQSAFSTSELIIDILIRSLYHCPVNYTQLCVKLYLKKFAWKWLMHVSAKVRWKGLCKIVEFDALELF